MDENIEIIQNLNEYNDQLLKLQKQLAVIKKERLNYTILKSSSIESMYPKYGEYYEIKDVHIVAGIKHACEYDYKDLELNQDVYYFASDNIFFSPKNDFGNDWGEEMPSVVGCIFDSDHNMIMECIRVDITNLKITIKDEVKSKDKTNIYVMIDKNTGYYKIGRSVKPKVREKTLQSEKPTIEMLFFNEGNNRDEKVLHNTFKDKRIRGEWFDLSGSDLVKIKEYFS